jgi:hypothetical protein
VNPSDLQALIEAAHQHDREPSWERSSEWGFGQGRESNLPVRIEALESGKLPVMTPGPAEIARQAEARAEAALHMATLAIAACQDLRDRLARLEDAAAEEPATEPDAIAQWLEANPEEVVKHRGKQIAVHPTDGIIASGADFRSVYEQVRARGYNPDDVVYDGVDINYSVKP